MVFAADLAETDNRVQLVRVSSSLAMEHWLATHALLAAGLLSAAAVVHRAQYEAVLRSVWLRYCANETQLAKLLRPVTIESDKAAQTLPLPAEMTKALEACAPSELASALHGFRGNSWKVLSSYAHAGLHAVRHHEDGYPEHLFEATACNANGLAMVGAMHTASLTEDEAFMKHIHSIQFKFPDCFAPK